MQWAAHSQMVVRHGNLEAEQTRLQAAETSLTTGLHSPGLNRSAGVHAAGELQRTRNRRKQQKVQARLAAALRDGHSVQKQHKKLPCSDASTAQNKERSLQAQRTTGAQLFRFTDQCGW
jgi:hypothetical protein